MTLTRLNVTVAQRVMIPTNIIFAAVLGYAYTFRAAELMDSSAYRGANEILPLQAWGIGFIGIAAWLFTATQLHRRSVYVGGLAWLFAWMLVWTGVFVAVHLRGDATFIAWVFPAYVSAACWASMLTLQAQET